MNTRNKNLSQNRSHTSPKRKRGNGFGIRSTQPLVLILFSLVGIAVPAWLVAQQTAQLTAPQTVAEAEPVQQANQSQPRPQSTAVLVIDFGDGFEKHYTRLEVGDTETVLGLLQAAKNHPRSLPFEYRGRGQTAFLTSLDGVANQGARGRNWIYYINGKIGDRSFAVARIEAGDVIAWRLERYQ